MEKPYKFCKTITPNNTTENILNAANEACTCRAVLVGGTGNISFLDGDGGESIITNLVVGQIYPISTRRINAANTTATNIKALW